MTVVEVPAGIDSNKIVKNAYAKYDLSLGIGLAQVNGKVGEDERLGSCLSASMSWRLSRAWRIS